MADQRGAVGGGHLSLGPGPAVLAAEVVEHRMDRPIEVAPQE